jgi:hypothetical protein
VPVKVPDGRATGAGAGAGAGAGGGDADAGGFAGATGAATFTGAADFAGTAGAAGLTGTADGVGFTGTADAVGATDVTGAAAVGVADGASGTEAEGGALPGMAAGRAAAPNGGRGGGAAWAPISQPMPSTEHDATTAAAAARILTSRTFRHGVQLTLPRSGARFANNTSPTTPAADNRSPTRGISQDGTALVAAGPTRLGRGPRRRPGESPRGERAG